MEVTSITGNWDSYIHINPHNIWSKFSDKCLSYKAIHSFLQMAG